MKKLSLFIFLFVSTLSLNCLGAENSQKTEKIRRDLRILKSRLSEYEEDIARFNRGVST